MSTAAIVTGDSFWSAVPPTSRQRSPKNNLT
jgi:hypothetical protein